MNIIKTVDVKIARGPLTILTAFILLLIFIALFTGYEDSKFANIYGGIIGGIVVFILNLIVEYSTYKRLNKLEKMQVQNVLKNRHNIDYYRKVLKNAQYNVVATGASCSRFITDFLDIDNEESVLIHRLRSHPNLSVRILIPDADNMDVESSQKFCVLKRKIISFQQEFPNRIEIRRFSSKARISAVVVDDEILVGPIFEEVESKLSPAIHISCSTDFGKKHIQYIDTIWEGGKVLSYD